MICILTLFHNLRDEIASQSAIELSEDPYNYKMNYFLKLKINKHNNYKFLQLYGALQTCGTDSSNHALILRSVLLADIVQCVT